MWQSGNKGRTKEKLGTVNRACAVKQTIKRNVQVVADSVMFHVSVFGFERLG